jgi:hypothetical protein
VNALPPTVRYSLSRIFGAVELAIVKLTGISLQMPRGQKHSGEGLSEFRLLDVWRQRQDVGTIALASQISSGSRISRSCGRSSFILRGTYYGISRYHRDFSQLARGFSVHSRSDHSTTYIRPLHWQLNCTKVTRSKLRLWHEILAAFHAGRPEATPGQQASGENKFHKLVSLAYLMDRSCFKIKRKE